MIFETNRNEAAEFLNSFIMNFNTLILFCFFIIYSTSYYFLQKHSLQISSFINTHISPSLINKNKILCKNIYTISIVLFIVSFIYGNYNIYDLRKSIFKLITEDNLDEICNQITFHSQNCLYRPVYRLIFSIHSNKILLKQNDEVWNKIRNTKIEYSSNETSTIILIIGESYSKKHSQLYGYKFKTTPFQNKMATEGNLITFNNIISYSNSTSKVFQNVFSLHSIDEKGGWYSKTLFPAIFLKAGYFTSFITNQFVKEGKNDIYDFYGGFFINNPQISNYLFSYRNNKKYLFDEGIINDYDKIKKTLDNYNKKLIIFHLIGQHVEYNKRFPSNRIYFRSDDYRRPDLKETEKQIIADYDNAVHYNDSIVNEIVKRFKDKDAIVLYMPDHGEEVYDDIKKFGRSLPKELNKVTLKNEFNIPFWIWVSNKYKTKHRNIVNQIIISRNNPYMTDDIPHTLLYLSGIKCKEYNSKRAVISPDFNKSRKRYVIGNIDYDKVMKQN